MKDGAVKLAYGGGKLTASGVTQTSSNKYRYLVTEFSAATGALLNTIQGAEDVTSIDQVQDLVIDDLGNIYVTGYAGATGEGYNMYTMKLDDDLNLLWDDSYNYSGSYDDRAYGIALDNSNNVIVTGCSDLGSGNTQFTTLKYNSTGTLQWTATEDLSNSGDTARAVVVDANNNIYVSGSFSNGSNQNVKTIKYSDGGSKKWEIDYNGTANGDEYILDMTLDGDDIIVTTQTWVGLNYKYATIKYSELEYSDLSFSSTEQINGIAFIKNNGQLRDTSGTGHSSVKYMSKYGPTMSFYKDDAFEWMTRTFHNDTTMNDTVQKVSFGFANHNTGVRVRPIGKSDYFENHYIPYGQKSYERLPVYGKLLYHNIWDDVDMETCITRDKELRFTVKPNGKANDIEMDITGADSTKKNTDGTVSVFFFNGAVKIPRARAYQETTPGNLQELAWQPALKLTGNTLSIDSIGSYNSTKDLVIRISKGGGDIPQADGFCHSTYLGEPNTAIYDATTSELDNKPYICGTNLNSNFYDDFNGQNIYGNVSWTGSFIAKFDAELVPEYATMIFGTRDEGNPEVWLSSIALKSDGKIIAVGRVWVDNIYTINSIDATFYENFPLGDRDGIILQLSEFNGAIEYSSFFGGEGDLTAGHDAITGIEIDENDRIYIIGNTTSTTASFPFEMLNGALYEEGEGAFIGLFSSSMDLEWCTNIGDDDDTFSDIDLSVNGKIAIAGRSMTESSFIPTMSGTTQVLTQNGADWFALVLDSNLQIEWGTYEGSDDDDIKGNADLAWDGNERLYFGANLFSVSNVNFIDFMGSAHFNNTNSGASSTAAAQNNYGLLVQYDANTYNPLWRTLIMDGEDWNKISSLDFANGNLIVSGFTRDETMDLEQADASLYSGVKTVANSGLNLESFVMIFDGSDKSINHSSYYGGHQSDENNAIVVNGEDDLFGFGFTASRYGPDLLGIPVYDNMVENSLYDDRGEFPFEYVNTGYIFKWCLNGTPLISNSDFDYSAAENTEITLHPNPIRKSETSMIQVNIDPLVNYEYIHIVDLSGRVVFTEAIFTDGIEDGLSFTLPGFMDSGVYLIQMVAQNTLHTTKLVLVD